MKTPDPLLFDRLADRFGVMADATRLHLLFRLKAGEARVCDLVAATRVAQPSVSKHLAQLRAAGLVACERRGNEAWYSVADATLFELCELVCKSVEDRLRTELRIVAPSARRL